LYHEANLVTSVKIILNKCLLLECFL